MKRIILFLAMLYFFNTASAQIIYTLKGDSVLITNCDSAELIIENHTQGIPGFLFNKGNGRTEFRRALIKINDSTFLVGVDSLKIPTASYWAKNGNNIYNTNAGNVGIHRSAPQTMLDLPGSINIDDSSSYRINTIPVLWIDSVGSHNLNGLYIGPNTGRSVGLEYENTFIGSKAGYVHAGGYNTFTGALSGANNGAYDGLSGYNTFYGASSGQNGVGGYNAYFGYNAGINAAGSHNTYVGSNAGNNITGSHNLVMGDSAGMSFSGADNTLIGTHVASSLTGSASGLTLVGAYADVNGSNLTNATAIGARAVVSSSNTMVFGDTAVKTWLFSSGAPATTGAALVVGSNSTNGNGAYLTTGGVWTNASDYFKKENFEPVNGEDVLEKIEQLPVTEWSYKGVRERHIGPVAQDFYRIFQVGADDKTITTIDPAGVALAGIQQLYKDWKNNEVRDSARASEIESQKIKYEARKIEIDRLQDKVNQGKEELGAMEERIRAIERKMAEIERKKSAANHH